MTVELSVLISFLGFTIVFARKMYPRIIEALDGYIESVRSKIHAAELLKEEASLALKGSYLKKGDIGRIIIENKKLSERKIERLYEENRNYLKVLRSRFEASLQARLELELAKQKNLLMWKLSDQLIEKLTDRVNSSDVGKFSADFAKEDLQKLM